VYSRRFLIPPARFPLGEMGGFVGRLDELLVRGLLHGFLARGGSELAVDGSGLKSDFAALLHHLIDELLVRSGRVAKKRTSQNSVNAKFADFVELRKAEVRLRRNLLPKLSEKGRRSRQCSLTEHQNGTFPLIFASQHVHIRGQSVTRTPFRTVSPGTWVDESRLKSTFRTMLLQPVQP